MKTAQNGASDPLRHDRELVIAHPTPVTTHASHVPVAWRERARMPPPRPSTTDEVNHLKACLTDLVGLVTVPVVCRDVEPSAPLDALLDVMVRVLRLDFA